MQTFITASGYTLIPPSGLTFVSKYVQLSPGSSATSSIRLSGNLGSFNNIFTVSGNMIPSTFNLDVPFLTTETVTLTPVNGTVIFGYVHGGNPEGYRYTESALQYAAASGIQKWPTTVLSGSFSKPYSGGYGG